MNMKTLREILAAEESEMQEAIDNATDKTVTAGIDAIGKDIDAMTNDNKLDKENIDKMKAKLLALQAEYNKNKLMAAAAEARRTAELQKQQQQQQQKNATNGKTDNTVSTGVQKQV